MRPHGVVIGVRSNEQSMLERIRREILLPTWTVEEYNFEILLSLFVGGERRRGFRDFSLLYDGWTRLARSHDCEEVYRLLETTLHQRVAQSAAHIFVRGVALALEGKATVLLNTGPDWLARQGEALRRRGAGVLSPEFAVLDADGLVYPYPNRIVMGDYRLEVAELGLEVMARPLPLARVLVAGGEQGDLSGARVAWHLFSFLQRNYACGDALTHLSRAVRLRATRGASLGPDNLPAAI